MVELDELTDETIGAIYNEHRPGGWTWQMLRPSMKAQYRAEYGPVICAVIEALLKDAEKREAEQLRGHADESHIIRGTD